jgi:hypothetical protein
MSKDDISTIPGSCSLLSDSLGVELNLKHFSFFVEALMILIILNSPYIYSALL